MTQRDRLESEIELSMLCMPFIDLIAQSVDYRNVVTYIDRVIQRVVGNKFPDNFCVQSTSWKHQVRKDCKIFRRIDVIVFSGVGRKDLDIRDLDLGASNQILL
jgi:hypothetical protein